MFRKSSPPQINLNLDMGNEFEAEAQAYNRSQFGQSEPRTVVSPPPPKTKAGFAAPNLPTQWLTRLALWGFCWVLFRSAAEGLGFSWVLEPRSLAVPALGALVYLSLQQPSNLAAWRHFATAIAAFYLVHWL